jgi:hypothetical protein
MSDDIVSRLRDWADVDPRGHAERMILEIIDEVEHLRADRDRWKDLAVKLLEANSRILDNE